MAKGDELAGIALGIIGGTLAAAAAYYLLSSKCPTCGSILKSRQPRCRKCGTYLRWD